MNASASRGAVIVLLGVLLGALVLWRIVPDAGPSAVQTTSDPVATVSPAVDATPTPTVGAAAEQPTSPAGAVPAPATNLAHAPNEVSVQVANGARVKGLAGKISTLLGQQNYNTRTPTNADAVATSTVYYQDGYDGDAQQILLEVLNTPNVRTAPMPDPPPRVDTPETGGVNILIIAGTDELSRL